MKVLNQWVCPWLGSLLTIYRFINELTNMPQDCACFIQLQWHLIHWQVGICWKLRMLCCNSTRLNTTRDNVNKLHVCHVTAFNLPKCRSSIPLSAAKTQQECPASAPSHQLQYKCHMQEQHHLGFKAKLNVNVPMQLSLQHQRVK